MLKQCEILDDWLGDLQASELPVAEKLKMEVQLSQLKRLLLIDEVAAMVQGVDSSEKEFMEMHDAFRRTCGPTYKSPAQ